MKQHKDQEKNNNPETKMGGKTTVWIFQATNKRNLTREDLEKETLKRETEFLLIAAQNNVIRTNYVKAKKKKR